MLLSPSNDTLNYILFSVPLQSHHVQCPVHYISLYIYDTMGFVIRMKTKIQYTVSQLIYEIPLPFRLVITAEYDHCD